MHNFTLFNNFTFIYTSMEIIIKKVVLLSKVVVGNLFLRNTNIPKKFPYLFFNGSHSLTDTVYIHYQYTIYLFDIQFFNILLPTKATDFIFLICSRFKHKQQELRQSLTKLCMAC